MPTNEQVNNAIAETSGTISLAEGYLFKYMIGGGRCPEVYGFTQCPDGSTLAKSGGWFRTTSPRDAAKTAHWNLYGDGLVKTHP